MHFQSFSPWKQIPFPSFNQSLTYVTTLRSFDAPTHIFSTDAVQRNGQTFSSRTGQTSGLPKTLNYCRTSLGSLPTFSRTIVSVSSRAAPGSAHETLNIALTTSLPECNPCQIGTQFQCFATGCSAPNPKRATLWARRAANMAMPTSASIHTMVTS